MSAHIFGGGVGALERLADGLAGKTKVAGDLADALTVDEITTANLA